MSLYCIGLLLLFYYYLLKKQANRPGKYKLVFMLTLIVIFYFDESHGGESRAQLLYTRNSHSQKRPILIDKPVYALTICC